MVKCWRDRQGRCPGWDFPLPLSLRLMTGKHCSSGWLGQTQYCSFGIIKPPKQRCQWWSKLKDSLIFVCPYIPKLVLDSWRELPKQVFETTLHTRIFHALRKGKKTTEIPNLGHATALAREISMCQQHGAKIETTGGKNLNIPHSSTLQHHLKGKKKTQNPLLKDRIKAFPRNKF